MTHGRQGECGTELGTDEVRMHGIVKNRFSDLTKEQEGRDRPRKDVMNRRQVKALRELSERAVMKEKRLGRVSPQERR